MRAMQTTLLAAAVLTIGSPGFAQNYKWSDIDCAQSAFAETQGMKCRETGEVAGGGTGLWRMFALASDDASVTLSMAAHTRSYVTPFVMENLKTYNVATKRGADWGQQQKASADITYMTFRDGQRSCMAFRREGPLRISGYAWMVWGMYCAAKNAALSPDEIAAVTQRFRPK